MPRQSDQLTGSQITLHFKLDQILYIGLWPVKALHYMKEELMTSGEKVKYQNTSPGG